MDDDDYEFEYDTRSKRKHPEESSDESEDDGYFETYDDDIRETIINHVLYQLTEDQRKGLSKKIRRGVNEGVSLCRDLVGESMGTLLREGPTRNMWKLGLGPGDIEKYSKELKRLRTSQECEVVTIKRILEANVVDDQKQTLLSLYDILQTLEPHSVEYLTISKKMNNIIDASAKVNSEIAQRIAKQEEDLKKLIGTEVSLRTRILSAEIDDARKAAIYEKYQLLQKTPEDSVTAASLQEWIEEALKTPFTKIKPNLFDTKSPGTTLLKLKQGFQEHLSEMDNVLEPLLSVFNNRMNQPDGKSFVIGLLGSPGVGKCLGVDTPILMYDGSIKRVQHIITGDLLMGDDSTPRTVQSTTSGWETMYKIHQGYGENYRVNESHILSLKLTVPPFITCNEEFGCYEVSWFSETGECREIVPFGSETDLPALGDIVDIPVTEYLQRSDEWRNAYKGYKVPVEYPHEYVKIDPYSYGLWLSGQNKVDLEVDNTNIPKRYLVNSRKVRLALLAGLIDGKGVKIRPGCFEIVESTTLIADIQELATSLGFRSELRPAYNWDGTNKQSTDVHLLISNAYGLDLKRFESDHRDFSDGDVIELCYDIEVVKEPVDEYYGFQIDGNHRFILGDYTVTHNTAVGQVIANVWDLPFQQISLGGVLDASILDGQHAGWVGSNPGRFAKALQEMGVINGVLFLDEIDKLGETSHGLQVQYSLLHSTDPVQNSHFQDHYLGSKLPLDLSKCLIICALNRTVGLDPALLNRMNIIKIPDYTPEQKTKIMIKHLFPKALQNAGLTMDDITLPESSCLGIQKVVEQANGKEGGVRGVKAAIHTIVDKLSLLLHTTESEREQLKLSFNIKMEKRPLVITQLVIEELYKTPKVEKLDNGMYS
jgi:hypothetical protein